MFGSLVPSTEVLLFHGIWKLLTGSHWPFPSAVSAQHFCKSGLRVSNQETGKLEDAANDPLWKVWLSKMGTIAKEIRARDCTRIKFFRRAHINCSAYVRFSFILCNFAASWAVQLWKNMMELLAAVPRNLTWPKQHSVLSEKILPWTKW